MEALEPAGALRIMTERGRQIGVEGYTPEGDVGRSEELMAAAACYTIHALALEVNGVDLTRTELPLNWPWEPQFWKPSTPMRDLEKAGALIAAAMDALQAEIRESGMI